jgi:dTDP-4-dehydrorhamnose 3,5-epimerase
MKIEIKILKLFKDEKGCLFETLRADDEIFDGKFGQTLVSVVYPGVIKGLHLHKKQTDYSTCIKGNVKYVAIEEKNKKIEARVFDIGEKNPILIKTPPGIWHGYMAVSEEAIMLHVADKLYDPKDDDTERVDPFYFGDFWNKK